MPLSCVLREVNSRARGLQCYADEVGDAQEHLGSWHRDIETRLDA
jgi:hypothetical protein